MEPYRIPQKWYCSIIMAPVFLCAMPSLSTLKKGQKAIITDISENELSLKLLDMGCLPGEEVIMIGPAPLGDPIMFHLGSYILSLRKEEAENIQIQIVE